MPILPLVDPLGPVGFGRTRPGPSLRRWEGTQDSYPIHAWSVTTTVDSAGVTSRTVTKPSVVPAGAWILGFLSGNLAGPPTLDVIPTGFAKVTGGIGVTTQLADGTNTYLDVVGRYVPDAATAAAIASETWTVTYSGASKGAYQFLVVTGLDAGQPFDGVSGVAETVASGSVTTHSTGTVSPTTSGHRLLQCYVDRLTGGVLLSLQTPYDERLDVAAAFPGTTNEIDSTLVLSPPLPAGTYSRTVGVTPNTAAAAVMWLAALRPSSGIVPVVEQGAGVAVAASTSAPVKVAVVSASSSAVGVSTATRPAASGVAEQGAGVGVATSTATAVKRAVVSAAAAAVATSSAVGRRVAVGRAAGAAVAVGTSVERKVAVERAAGAAAAAATAVGVKRAVEVASGSAAAVGTAVDVKRAVEVAAGVGVATGTSTRSAARSQAGASQALAVGSASAVRRAVLRAAGAAVAAASAVGVRRAVLSGAAAAAATSAAVARRVAVERGTAAAVVVGTAAARRVAIGRGSAVAVGTAAALRPTAAPVTTFATMSGASTSTAAMTTTGAAQTGSGAAMSAAQGAVVTGASSGATMTSSSASDPSITRG